MTTPPSVPQIEDFGRDLFAPIPSDFRLASGERLDASRVQGRLHGPADGPLVVVAGGISAGRFPVLRPDGGPGWWPWAVGPGASVDTRRLRVLAFDFLPNRGQGEPVTITTQDQARLLTLLLDHAGEPHVDAFVGASYGGCVGLAFAEVFSRRLGRLLVISAAHRAAALATGWRGVQRRLLALGQAHGCEAEAIALARELAMTTYRTPEEFEQRFGGGDLPERAGDPYAVCDYLTARGDGYDAVTSVSRWISLSDSLDRHRVDPAAVAAPLTLVGFTSDRLAPIEDLRALAAAVPDLERFVEAPSLYGHDAFLKERGVIAEALETFLAPIHALCRREIAA